MSTLFSRVREAIATIDKGVGPVGGSGDRAFGMLSGVLGAGRNPPIRQRHDLLESYSRLPWLRSIVSRIGYAVAATQWEALVEIRGAPEVLPTDRGRLPLVTMRALADLDVRVVSRSKLRRAGIESRHALRMRKQVHGEVVELEDHPIIDLLENFNPVITGMAGMKLTQSHLDLVGEAFWLKERDPLGKPTAIWPLAPPWIEETPTPSSPFYIVSWNAWRVKIPETEIVWFCDNDPARPYWRGVGTGVALADELETDEYAAKHTKREFFNNAVPELLITADGLGEEETRRLERDWRHKNRGFFKALQVYFISRKVDVKPLGQSFKSLQLIELRKWERDIIIEVFGVPPEILGIVNESKRATIDAADFLFARWVLTPRLELIRSVLQERLVPDFDERLVLDYENPIREDQDRQLKAAQSAPWAITVDEWRALQGHEPLSENRGKIHMSPNNVTPMAFPARDDDGKLLPSEEPVPTIEEPPEPESVEPVDDGEVVAIEEDESTDEAAAKIYAKHKKGLASASRGRALVAALDRVLDENLRLSS